MPIRYTYPLGIQEARHDDGRRETERENEATEDEPDTRQNQHTLIMITTLRHEVVWTTLVKGGFLS